MLICSGGPLGLCMDLIIDFYIYLSQDLCSRFRVSSCNPLMPGNVFRDILNN